MGIFVIIFINFSIVYKAKDLRRNSIVALKKILFPTTPTTNSSTTTGGGFPIPTLREIAIMKHINHPNVLSLDEMAFSVKNEFYMVVPYMEHDLTGILQSDNVILSIGQIKCYMKQLLEGVKYLHSQDIIHRDLKSSNLLLNDIGQLKIADFGLARHISRQTTTPPPMSPNVVTLWYRAPELLCPSLYTSSCGNYSFPIDLWSVGCIFAELLLRRPLFPGESELEQMGMIFKICGRPPPSFMGVSSMLDFSKYPEESKMEFYLKEQIGASAFSLLKEFLNLDPLKRITAKDALNHRYFTTAPLAVLPQSLPNYGSLHENSSKKRKVYS